MKTLVLGVLPDGASADSAVNNLMEEGYSARSLSVVMQDTASARAILSSVGPLGAGSVQDLETALVGRGMTDATARGYVSALENGGALLAVAVSGDTEVQSVQASLAVYRAQMMTVLE